MTTAKLMPKFRVWLEYGDVVIGEGLYQLLMGISASGSISQAASGMKMSYRQAWGKIRKTEKKIGVNLIAARTGGHLGGGAQLTAEGEDLLRRYSRFRRELDASVREAFDRNFGGITWSGRQPVPWQG